jgi:hypothetical protein
MAKIDEGPHKTKVRAVPLRVHLERLRIDCQDLTSQKADSFWCALLGRKFISDYTFPASPRKPKQWTYGAWWIGVIGENKSGHISVRTHVRRRAQILKNSGGMSGVLDSEGIET